MSAGNFDACFASLLIDEGGYTNDPHDPGGATNLGVIQTEYNAYRTRKNLLTQSVRYITKAEAAEIYRFQYWASVHADDLPAGIDYVVFDEAVNSGPQQSVRDLQKALGTVKVDGWIGLETLGAVCAFGNDVVLIGKICEIRLGWLRRLKTWIYFGKGWSNRVAHVRRVALAMATGH